MRCRVANMAKKVPPGFPSALKKTILSGMFTLNPSVLMLFRPNMGPARRLLSSHDWHCCWQRRPDCSLDLPDSHRPTLGRHLRCLPARSSAVWLRCFGLRSLWPNDAGAVTKKEKKTQEDVNANVEKRSQWRQKTRRTMAVKAMTQHFLWQDEDLPSIKINHPDSDTVKKQSGKVTPQPQQCHEILFSVSWTASAVREREASVEQERSSEWGERRTLWVGTQRSPWLSGSRSALAPCWLTAAPTGGRQAGLICCTSPATISQTLVTAPIQVTDTKAVCVLQTHSGAQMWTSHSHSDPVWLHFLSPRGHRALSLSPVTVGEAGVRAGRLCQGTPTGFHFADANTKPEGNSLWRSGLFWGKVEYFCMNVSFNLVMLIERYLVTVAIMVLQHKKKCPSYRNGNYQ